MTIEVLDPALALKRTAASLGLACENAGESDFACIVAQAVRRASLALCPCGRGALERVVTQSLAPIAPADAACAETVSAIIEQLLAYGDLLEMNESLDPGRRASFVVRPATPHFVETSQGTLVLLGVGSELVTPLAPSLASKIQYRGVLRFLPTVPGDEVEQDLIETGIPKLSPSAWLRLPRLESAAEYRSRWLEKLSAAGPSGSIEALRLIAPDAPVKYYNGRWIEPQQRSGIFVARRSQLYGSDLWCLVEIASGTPQKLLDFASVGDRLRPCDLAWRLQMAFDAGRNVPQVYRMTTHENHTKIEFFSPIPSWAERKFLTIGKKIVSAGCLFAYHLPREDTAEVCQFIDARLWLAPTKD